MTGRRRIARVDGGHRRLDEAFENVFDLVVEPRVLDRDRGHARERPRETHMPIRERHDVAIGVLVLP